MNSIIHCEMTVQYLLSIFLVLLLPVSAYAETLSFKSVVIPSDLTATLSGALSFPAGPGPFPVVVLLHPCGGLDATALTTLRAHSRELLSNGFATLILDSFGPRNLMGGKACGGLGTRQSWLDNMSSDETTLSMRWLPCKAMRKSAKTTYSLWV